MVGLTFVLQLLVDTTFILLLTIQHVQVPSSLFTLHSPDVFFEVFSLLHVLHEIHKILPGTICTVQKAGASKRMLNKETFLFSKIDLPNSNPGRN